MREALGISGKFGEATMAARHAYLKRFFPDIGDDNCRAMSKQMTSQPIFAEFSRSKRLQLIREEEAAEGDATTCPLHMMQWSDATEGPVPYNPWGADQQYFIRGF